MIVSISASRIMLGMPAAFARAGVTMGAAPIAIAASREMNFLRISAIVAFVQTAKSFVSRPQLFLLSLCLAGLAGCGDPAPTVSDFGSGTVKGFGGAVAADEPRAALVARDV